MELDIKTEMDGETSVLTVSFAARDETDMAGLPGEKQVSGVNPSPFTSGAVPTNDSRLRRDPGVGAQGRTKGEAA